MIKDETLITPTFTDAVLESIIRDSVIKIAKSLGYPVVERTIDRTELYTADEAFLCGSAMEVTPIYTVDRYAIGTGEQGKWTKKIHLKYLECVQGKQPKYQSWLTPIY